MVILNGSQVPGRSGVPGLPGRSGLPAVVGAAGALGTVAWLIGRSGPDMLAQVFLVAAPVRIVTGYVDLPARARLLGMGSVAALNSLPSLFLGMAGMYTEGRRPGGDVAPPRLYGEIQRCRQQLWWWSSGVAAGTLLWTGSVRRALAVMLAGNPSALITALAIATWRETAQWAHRGVYAAHPLSLMAAGEVDTVLFALPDQPSAAYKRWVRSLVPALRGAGYAVGFVSGSACDHTRALARELDIDRWYAGTGAERLRWVGELCAGGHTVAMVNAPESAPVAVAIAGPGGPAAGCAELTLAVGGTATLADSGTAILPAVLAESRRHNRTARQAVTISRTLAVAATVATAAGVLAATNLLTVANILGLGLITLNQAFRRAKR